MQERLAGVLIYEQPHTTVAVSYRRFNVFNLVMDYMMHLDLAAYKELYLMFLFLMAVHFLAFA